jgi:hypothetical protein
MRAFVLLCAIVCAAMGLLASAPARAQAPVSVRMDL